MSELSLNLHAPSKLSNRRLSFNLTVKDGNQVEVRSCEVTGRTFRNRTLFSGVSALEDIVVGKMADAINRVIRSLPPTGAHVLSLPDFLVELPGLALAGAHVMVTDVHGGARNAIFRFKEFLGASNLAFKLEIGFQENREEYNEQLATNILADICLPILNLCRHAEFSQIDPAGSMARRLREKAMELEFQTELLKRFVYNSACDKPDTSFMPQRWAPHVEARLTQP